MRVANLDPAAEHFKYNVAFGERAAPAPRGGDVALLLSARRRRAPPRMAGSAHQQHLLPCVLARSLARTPTPRSPADIRDLVSVDDVMQEMGFGPNGALLFCMEYLLEDDSGWLAEQLEGYLEDDYLLLDCPGQIELYSHIPVFKRVAAMLQGYGFNVRAAAHGRELRRAQAAGRGARVGGRVLRRTRGRLSERRARGAAG